MTLIHFLGKRQYPSSTTFQVLISIRNSRLNHCHKRVFRGSISLKDGKEHLSNLNNEGYTLKDASRLAHENGSNHLMKWLVLNVEY